MSTSMVIMTYCQRHRQGGLGVEAPANEMWVEANNMSFIDIAFYDSGSLTIFVKWNWKLESPVPVVDFMYGTVGSLFCVCVQCHCTLFHIPVV